jgi:adenylyltransferase/sulfurtransferase
MDERYSRQIAFYGIGAEGQQKLSAARVAIIGLGALGTAAADRLCRAGIGFLRLVDSDVVELSNLQRQSLYTEADVGAVKVTASAARLREISSAAIIETVHKRIIGAGDAVFSGVDVVLDCTDNAAVRRIINAECHRLQIPWIHGAAAGSGGVVFAVIPGGACFRCLYPGAEIEGDTAGTLGMLNPLTATVGALQANEAMKIIVGAPTAGLMMFDIWNGVFEFIRTERDADCAVCGV